MNGLLLMTDIKNSLYSYLSDFFGIACFSKSYSELLMWAHYADSGKGICLIFKEDLFKIASNGYPKILPVDYQDKIPNIGVHITKEKCNYEITPAITIKRTNWAYEKEYRAIINFSPITPDINTSRQVLKTHSNKIRNIQFKPDKLVGIILGHQCSTKNINKIKKEILEKNSTREESIKLYQSKIDKITGKYTFVEIK